MFKVPMSVFGAVSPKGPIHSLEMKIQVGPVIVAGEILRTHTIVQVVHKRLQIKSQSKGCLIS